MGFVAHQDIATVGLLCQSTNVRSNTFVTGDENIEHLSVDKAINILFDGLSVSFGKCHTFDGSNSKPLIKLVRPILDKRTGTDHHNSLGCGSTIGCNSGLQQSVNQSNRLERFPQALTQNETVSYINVTKSNVVSGRCLYRTMSESSKVSFNATKALLHTYHLPESRLFLGSL